MNKEEMLFEFKPCHQCPHSCVEGQIGVKCPFDLMVDDLINTGGTAPYEFSIDPTLVLMG